jgi:serine/threonine-protein kinase
METGRTIAGKYRLKRLLGTGGMASVWAATNVFTERDCAIKFMLPQLARTPEAAARFLLEARVSARINHPSVIDVIDVGRAEDGSLFLVMELLAGASLDVAIRRQRPPMTVHAFTAFMRDVAVALAAAHRSGVIHRDLKPTNIFLHKDRDQRLMPKILDFGVSKILEEEQNTSLTIAGTVLGSPHYMSPEQAMGAAGIDGRTDIFAFGGILFEALTGERAYGAANFNALIVTIATKEPKRIDDIAPQLPETLRALVRECLATNKEARVASFDLVAERITGMLPELEATGLALPLPSGADAPATLRHETPQPSAPMDATPSGAVATFVRRLPRRTLALAGGAVAIVVLLIGVVSTFARRAESARSTHAYAAPAQSPSPAVPKAASPAETTSGISNEVPVISVDSLPLAARASKRNARLSISASRRWCSVSIDGIPRGVTPLTSFELGPGTHHVDCVPPLGKPQSATVTVSEGASGHYTFNLDE